MPNPKGRFFGIVRGDKKVQKSGIFNFAKLCQKNVGFLLVAASVLVSVNAWADCAAIGEHKETQILYANGGAVTFNVTLVCQNMQDDVGRYDMGPCTETLGLPYVCASMPGTFGDESTLDLTKVGQGPYLWYMPPMKMSTWYRTPIAQFANYGECMNTGVSQLIDMILNSLRNVSLKEDIDDIFPGLL